MKTFLKSLSSLKSFASLFTSRSHAPALQRSFSSAFLRGDDTADANAATLTSAFHQSTWIYACVTTLAENVSSIPFTISSSSSSSSSSSISAAEQLFAHPHPNLDRFQFWDLIVTWLCLRGEAFIYPVSSSALSVQSAVKNLLVLSPDHLHEIIVNNDLAGWRYSAPSASSFSLHPSSFGSILLPEELIHIRLPNPFNFWRGMSPLTVACLAAQTDYAASQFMKGAMINNLDTGVIVTTERQLTPDQSEAIRGALRERKRKAGTADRPLLLWGGAKIEKPTVSAMDLQFLENRKFNRQEICAIYKVPQELLGYTEDANRSVSEAARLNFVENRVAPLCKRLEAGIDPIIKMFGRDLRGQFHINATPVMQSAQRARIDSGLKLFSVGVPLNIVNQVLDLGLPELAHGDRTFLSARYQELKSKSTPVAADVSRLTLKTSRELFGQRSRALAALEKVRPQIEAGIVPELFVEDRLKAIIADAIHRREPYELIAQRVRAHFNQMKCIQLI